MPNGQEYIWQPAILAERSGRNLVFLPAVKPKANHTEHHKNLHVLLPGKLAYVSTVIAPDMHSEQLIDNMMVRFVSSDFHRQYLPFVADFGPVDLGVIHSFCKMLLERLATERCLLAYWVDSSFESRSNACFLLSAFLVLHHGWTPENAVKAFTSSTSCYRFRPFLDISGCSPAFELTIEDCLNGLKRATQLGWYEPDKFDIDSYRNLDHPLNAELHIVCPKFAALKSPLARSYVKQQHTLKPSHSSRDLTAPPPEHLIPILRRLGISCIIRLSHPDTYDPAIFSRAGVRHEDILSAADGEFDSPSEQDLQRFLDACDRERRLAVHCRTGLGRTGTLIAAWLVRRAGFRAAEAVGWIRIVRPGAVVGPQQQFLSACQRRIWAGNLLLPESPPAPPAADSHAGGGGGGGVGTDGRAPANAAVVADGSDAGGGEGKEAAAGGAQEPAAAAAAAAEGRLPAELAHRVAMCVAARAARKIAAAAARGPPRRSARKALRPAFKLDPAAARLGQAPTVAVPSSSIQGWQCGESSANLNLKPEGAPPRPSRRMQVSGVVNMADPAAPAGGRLRDDPHYEHRGNLKPLATPGHTVAHRNLDHDGPPATRTPHRTPIGHGTLPVAGWSMTRTAGPPPAGACRAQAQAGESLRLGIHSGMALHVAPIMMQSASTGNLKTELTLPLSAAASQSPAANGAAAAVTAAGARGAWFTGKLSGGAGLGWVKLPVPESVHSPRPELVRAYIKAARAAARTSQSAAPCPGPSKSVALAVCRPGGPAVGSDGLDQFHGGRGFTGNLKIKLAPIGNGRTAALQPRLPSTGPPAA